MVMDAMTHSDDASGRQPQVRRRTLLLAGLGALTTVGGATACGTSQDVGTGATPATTPGAPASPTAAVVTKTATSYQKGATSVTIRTATKDSGKDLIKYFVADIEVATGKDLRSAFANDKFARNSRALPTELAAAEKAMVAINGDFAAYRKDGIVIRSGEVLRDKGARQGLAFHADGTARVYDEQSTTAAELLADGVWHTLSFGPALLDNGAIPAGIEEYEIGDFGPVVRGGPGSIQGEQPRSGIGFVDQNHYLMIAVSGRGAGGSRGATMTEFAEIFREAGATVAYNLDGGASSTLVFDGKVVNDLAGDGGKQRASADILYVAG